MSVQVKCCDHPACDGDAGVEARYHVPRSQAYENSRGGQSGAVHLHVTVARPRHMTVALTADHGRRTTIYRHNGDALCGRNGWYERPPEPDEPRCDRCLRMAARYGVEWPDADRGGS